MTVSSINPAFQGEFSARVGRQIERNLLDPTQVNNKDAAVGGVVAAGGASGAAIVASRLKTMKNVTNTAQTLVTKAVNLNKQNASILTRFGKTIAKAFGANSVAAKLLKNKYVAKVGGFAGGALALGITAAQLFSAGDMAVEAVKTYSKD